jgi:hypothetical protein
MKIGFVIPSLEREGSLLLGCLQAIEAAVVQTPGAGAALCVIWQGTAEALVPIQAAVQGALHPIHFIIMHERGVSQARNRGLCWLEAEGVDALMFVDVSVRPEAGFLRAAWAALASGHAAVSAPIGFTAQVPHGRLGARGEVAVSSGLGFISAARLIIRGFIWSCLFQAAPLRGLRFDEKIGPGTTSLRQAGEDADFLYRFMVGQGVQRMAFLKGVSVHRLPRPDIAAKIKHYAYGQGFQIGFYAHQAFSGAGLWSAMNRAIFLGWAVLFIANSMRLSFKAGGGPLCRARLRGVSEGWRDSGV